MEALLPNISDSILFDEAPCYISIQDSNYQILKINRRFRDMFGNRVGDFCYAVYKQREDRCPTCYLDKTFAEGKQHQSEEVVFSPEGFPIHVVVNTTPIYDNSGKIVAIMELATDITETKRLQHKLEENSQKYRTLYDLTPCFISVQDRQFRIIDSNKRFKDEFGSKYGGYCYEVYKRRTSRCDICPVAEAFEDGKIHTSEEIVASGEGEPRNVLVFAAPLRNSEGLVEQVMEMSTDITCVKKMQSQMANVGQLVASLAHTIKGIITGLEGGMYVVESGFSKNKDEQVKRGWEMVQRNIERISQLSLDMLYFAKSREPEIKTVDMEQYCREIAELYSKKFKNFNIDFIVAANEVKPYAGDPKALYTLALTLVENAVDACRWDKEKDSHNIKLELYDENETLHLKITDDGIGITPETKTKLFSVMYSTKGSSGSGFGLMVVKKIIDEHSGEISVESESGKGSTFHVILPRNTIDYKIRK